MSTFDGFVWEFPRIRIDNFRLQPDRPSPLACFLSHVHSDHLTGLVSLKAPFVYCSAATRQILLRLETYRHRMNLARGITEVSKLTYRSLHKLLKPLPLETPTKIELTPGNFINVTLFNANHCVGAVMFLIESPSTAVLYTGDIRAEAWWVNALVRQPKLLPYIAKPFGAGTKRLANIYLDTTFAMTSTPFRSFASKAEGLAELLHEIAQFPEATAFYFHAWTFGYEDVMLALSQALGSRIHLDPYRYRVYDSLSKSSVPCSEASMFSGFLAGNIAQPGMITDDPSVRLHSCELGTSCWSTDPSQDTNVVHIKPVVSRHNGENIQEVGLGGGQGDLDQVHELELGDTDALQKLLKLCNEKFNDGEDRNSIIEYLERQLSGKLPLDHRIRLDSALRREAGDLSNDVELECLARTLQTRARHAYHSSESLEEELQGSANDRCITFPYSRHSSYSELRYLIEKLNPLDIYPCTAPTPAEYTESHSMQALFGDLLSGERETDIIFFWDSSMRRKQDELNLTHPPVRCNSASSIQGSPNRGEPNARAKEQEVTTEQFDANSTETSDGDWAEAPELPTTKTIIEADSAENPFHIDCSPTVRRSAGSLQVSKARKPAPMTTSAKGAQSFQKYPKELRIPAAESSPTSRLQNREDAYDAALNGRWGELKLQSTGRKRTLDEVEL